MTKIDRRVRRTRRMLSEALFALLLQKEFETITIQDITDEADIHRATFYLHYSTKEELLAASLQSLFDELADRIQGNAGKPLTFLGDKSAASEMIFTHVADHASLYRILLGKSGVGYVTHQVLDYMTAVMEQKLRQDFPDESQAPLPLILVARHAAGSLYGLASWWVAADMPYPAKKMAEIAHGLMRQGALAMLDTKNDN